MKTRQFQLTLKKRFLMFIVLLMPGISILFSQSLSHYQIGIGGGLSYGGLGAQLAYKPTEQLGLFGSLGYNLDAIGYNLGVKIYAPSEKKTSIYLTGMYGYNTVLIVDAITMKSKTTYYGFSTGIGVEFKFKKRSFLSAEVLVPFRPQAYKDATDDLRSINYEIQDPLPVAICIGYHLRF